MTKVQSEFLNILVSRGFLHQCTDLSGLDAIASKKKITVYNGFDATADSLHIGNLLTVMVLRWVQKTGHRPLVLVGGGTTKVGDPSGKDEVRKLLNNETISANISSIQQTFGNFLNFGEGDTDAILVNNADWLDELHYIPFLREIGSSFSINRMLTMDSVKSRLDREQPLTFLEFNYMILQSYDFVELHKRYGCVLQTGGSDQWGNIVNGVDLGRRLIGAELYGLTCPLITTASGQKMGKTAAGAIWLNPERLSPYDYYQFWRNTDDVDVTRFLRLFTEVPLEEIQRLEGLEGAEINEAKKLLAFETTHLLHGHDAARSAESTSLQTFELGNPGGGLPSVEIEASRLDSGVLLPDLLVQSGLTISKGEARRLIRGSGARVNDKKIIDETLLIDNTFAKDGVIKLSSGKKKHALVIVKGYSV